MTLPAYLICVDLGQVADPSAICVLERRELLTGRMELAYRIVGDGTPDFVRRIAVRQAQTAGFYQVVHLERLALGTPYTAIPGRLDTLEQQLQQRWADAAFEAIGHGVDHRQAPIDLVIDQTGVGRPVVDLLLEAGLNPVCITITGGDMVTRVSSAEYRVPKRDLVSAVNAAMQARRLKAAEALPDWPVLRAELVNFKAKISLSGHDSYEAGPAGEWREGAHDDLVLALALGVWWGEYANQHGQGASYDEIAGAFVDMR